VATVAVLGNPLILSGLGLILLQLLVWLGWMTLPGTGKVLSAGEADVLPEPIKNLALLIIGMMLIVLGVSVAALVG